MYMYPIFLIYLFITVDLLQILEYVYKTIDRKLSHINQINLNLCAPVNKSQKATIVIEDNDENNVII